MVTTAHPRKILSVVAAAAVVATSLVTLPPLAAAAPGDDLDVSFGGSLVGTTAYTTTEGEQMSGVLRRVAGAEEQVPGVGVRLLGGTQGLRFDAANLELGPAAGLIDQSFVVEARFTPTSASYANQTTLISAGGNFAVRYQGGQFTYGFDSNAGGSWAQYRESVPSPAINEEHAISVHYIAEADGSVTVEAMLDGEELTTIEAPASARLSAGFNKSFGFGHEVHPQGDERGFTGSIR